MDAVACFHQIGSESAQWTEDEHLDWMSGERSFVKCKHEVLSDGSPSGFKYRCRHKLEGLGDTNVNARRYDEAISLYTATLSLEPASPQVLFVKRSRAHAGRGAWEDALDDANKVFSFLTHPGHSC